MFLWQESCLHFLICPNFGFFWIRSAIRCLSCVCITAYAATSFVWTIGVQIQFITEKYSDERFRTFTFTWSLITGIIYNDNWFSRYFTRYKLYVWWFFQIYPNLVHKQCLSSIIFQRIQTYSPFLLLSLIQFNWSSAKIKYWKVFLSIKFIL